MWTDARRSHGVVIRVDEHAVSTCEKRVGVTEKEDSFVESSTDFSHCNQFNQSIHKSNTSKEFTFIDLFFDLVGCSLETIE